MARKKFRGLCRRLLTEKLEALGVGPVEIVTGNWAHQKLTDPRAIPLVTYGVRGINRFEDFDAAWPPAVDDDGAAGGIELPPPTMTTGGFATGREGDWVTHTPPFGTANTAGFDGLLGEVAMTLAGCEDSEVTVGAEWWVGP